MSKINSFWTRHDQNVNNSLVEDTFLFYSTFAYGIKISKYNKLVMTFTS